MIRKFALVALFCLVVISVPVVPAEPSSAPRTAKIVARFVSFGASASRPVGYGNVRVEIRDWVYRKKTDSKGWLVLNVPCNTDGRIVFGDNGENSVDIAVPCTSRPVSLGAFDWRDGQFVGEDMNQIDGCRLCD